MAIQCPDIWRIVAAVVVPGLTLSLRSFSESDSDDVDMLGGVGSWKAATSH